MASIVKYTRKDGSTYAYSSTAQWDPLKKQSRPVRKYLGKVNPDTGEIIPSSGKRGRPVGSKNKPQSSSRDSMQGETSAWHASHTTSALEDEVKKLQEQLAAKQMEINSLRNKIAHYENVLKSIKMQVSKAVE